MSFFTGKGAGSQLVVGVAVAAVVALAAALGWRVLNPVELAPSRSSEVSPSASASAGSSERASAPLAAESAGEGAK
ncbi:MAG: hypothetical protein D6811_10740, partial [Alphaproteobacteria bacterium]